MPHPKDTLPPTQVAGLGCPHGPGGGKWHYFIRARMQLDLSPLGWAFPQAFQLVL